uniref:Fem-3 mRNA-binding factor 2 n=1 Tax=Ascaris suum TaxID=6253 RepID=F1KXL7_ASCSU
MRVLKTCNRQNIRLHSIPRSVSAFAKNNIVSESSAIKLLTPVASGDASLQSNYWTENKENVSPASRYVPETTKGVESVSVSVKDLEELSEVVGDMVMSEFGFRYIMNLLSRRNGHFRRCLYESIFSQRIFNIVSNNCYGHRIVELLVANANALEQQLIANTLRGHMVEFVSTRFTSWVVQSALWKLDLPTCSTLLAELRGVGHYLATNSYASHVVEVIFSRMRPLHYGFIIDEIISSPVVIVDVACSKYGCRVLESAIQVMFDGAKEYRSSVADDYLNKLLKAIVDACCLNLVADEYGNFVVQKILAYKQFAEYADAIIVNIISRNVLVLSQTKHGSHVIQAVLRNASPKSLRLIMREIFDGYYLDTQGKDALDVMMMDGYGNYVVQTMLDVSIAVSEKKRDGLSEWFERLAGRIIRAKNRIIHLSSGKKLVATLNQVLGTLYEPTTCDDATEQGWRVG